MTTEQTATDFLRKAANAAEHFGFGNASEYRAPAPLEGGPAAPLRHTASAQDRRLDALNGMLAAGIGTYTDRKIHTVDGPVMLYSIEQVPRSGEAAIALHVFNVEKSIAESLLIQTARAIAYDLGFTEQNVRINSHGDNDSANRYTRELTNFLRKRAGDLPQTARDLMKEHSIAALIDMVESGHELAHRAPSPLEYLSDASRRHFREIVEYLEMSETPYEIDPKLIGHLHCYSDALFAIDCASANSAGETPLLIRGGRYDAFVRRHTRTNTAAAAGAVIVFRGKKAPRRQPRSGPAVAPSVYVVQLGSGPKMRSLMLIDSLRGARIPAYQNLASDSLSAQLRDAEDRQVKYTILIGQKEFVDNTVILRDMQGRNQEHVPIGELLPRLRKLRTSVS